MTQSPTTCTSLQRGEVVSPRWSMTSTLSFAGSRKPPRSHFPIWPWPSIDPCSRSRLIDEHGATFPIEEVRAAWIRHFDAIVSTRLSLKPGAAELLDTLDELRLPRAIATSSSHKTAQHHLTAHALVERFHEIVA